MKVTTAAYVYPGWHPCPERDRHFTPGWTEWDLVYQAKPLFDGHRQPNLPRGGRYDDSDPDTARRQIALARQFNVDLFVYGFFWSRGKRVLDGALDTFVATERFPFALMWANRMPRRILPVKKPSDPLIDPGRLVHTDPQDFERLIAYLAERYFSLPSYFRKGGAPYLSIFDTSFFLRQLGPTLAREAISNAKRYLRERGLGGLHLAAIDPAMDLCEALREVGFDSVTHYVLLPEWKGEAQQEFTACAAQRRVEWPTIRQRVALPYYPSISPGWDATPRASDYGKQRPKRYPWSPIVTGSTPETFASLTRDAKRYVVANEPDPMLFVASWNEWGEGHYLEPDERYGTGWLEALLAGRS